MTRTKTMNCEEGFAMTFEWDEDKDQRNRQKHGAGFDEAKTAFGDPYAISIADPEHSDEEA